MWTPGQTVSSPVLTADPPVVALDAAGEPFALWREVAPSTFASRIHGARLVTDPPPPDTTPPTLTTRLPKTVTVGKNGAFAFIVPFGCDEACDVRVDVADTNPHLLGYDQREFSFPDAAQGAVRLAPSARERRAVKDQRPTRMRITVEAADRAGNVATASVTARVQRR
jgi:hypothetical protein